jgi:hypothetical protein
MLARGDRPQLRPGRIVVLRVPGRLDRDCLGLGFGQHQHPPGAQGVECPSVISGREIIPAPGGAEGTGAGAGGS